MQYLDVLLFVEGRERRMIEGGDSESMFNNTHSCAARWVRSGAQSLESRVHAERSGIIGQEPDQIAEGGCGWGGKGGGSQYVG